LSSTRPSTRLLDAGATRPEAIHIRHGPLDRAYALDGAYEIWMYIWISRKNAVMHSISLQHNVYASMRCTDAPILTDVPKDRCIPHEATPQPWSSSSSCYPLSHGVLQAPHSRPRPAATQHTMHATHSRTKAECTTGMKHADVVHFLAGMVDCHAAAVAAATALLSSDRKQGTCTTACCTACRATQVCSMQGNTSV
jgi:hypothetical protein